MLSAIITLQESNGGRGEDLQSCVTVPCGVIYFKKTSVKTATLKNRYCVSNKGLTRTNERSCFLRYRQSNHCMLLWSNGREEVAEAQL